jgi:hypothetical protein
VKLCGRFIRFDKKKMTPAKLIMECTTFYVYVIKARVNLPIGKKKALA